MNINEVNVAAMSKKIYLTEADKRAHKKFYDKERYIKNREENILRSKLWYEKHNTRITHYRHYSKLPRKRVVDKVKRREYDKINYAKNKVAILSRQKEYRKMNPEKVSACQKICYNNKKDEYLAKRNKYTKLNLQWIRPYNRERAKKTRAKLREIVLKHYGEICVCCGEKEPKMLTGGWAFYKWVIKNNFPEYLQILCWNCNVGKRFNKGVCPHKGVM